jgi:GDP-L-fucose synthase
LRSEQRSFDLRGHRVWVAGHRGMVGSAVVRRLASEPCTVLTAERQQLDLTKQSDVETWIMANRPSVIVMAAAKVGGILANDTQAAEFIQNNLTIQTNIIHSSHKAGVDKVLFLGSSCVYPKLCPQPIKEEYLLTGPLEPTNEWYAGNMVVTIFRACRLTSMAQATTSTWRHRMFFRHF